MANRQRARAAKKERNPNQLAGLGIFNIPDLDAMGLTDTLGDESDSDDADLESELEAILSGKTGTKTKPVQTQDKKKVAPLDIEKLSLRMDVFDDDDDEDDDKNLNDPDLLNELKALTCSEEKEVEIIERDENSEILSKNEKSSKDSHSILSLLNDRLVLYNEALASAKILGDSSKVRRFNRGIKSLENMITSAKAGRVVNVEDIPPIVSVPRPKNTEAAGESERMKEATLNNNNTIPTANLLEENKDISSKNTSEKTETERDAKYLETLKSRREKYKIAALNAKKNGEKATALEYMKIFKKFDALIQTPKGEEIDISLIPPSPPPSVHHTVSPPDPSPKENGEIQTSSLQAAALSAASEPEDPTLFDAPSAPTSVLEALNQRLEKFASTLSAAKADGNISKVRRLERIVRSYEKSIGLYKSGKPVDFEGLPAPPGFPAIPPEEGTSISPSKLEKREPAKNPREERAVPKRQAPDSKIVDPSEKQKPKVQKTTTSLADKQLEFLLERQRLFREAAIAAKKNGNTQEAMEYLRLSKGFTSMCDAVKCGLPIDMSSIPTPPQLVMNDCGFEIIDRFECEENSDTFETFNLILKDLNEEIEMCKQIKQLFLALGDVSAALKFEKLYLDTQKDLSVVVNFKNLGEPPPKFYYETRSFAIVQCNADLSDDEIAISVVRGINLPGKAHELDSYVKVEFPIPSDAPQKAKTRVIKDTNNPVFEEEFKFTFNRKSRTQLRQFKRQFLRLEVYSKGGFLRSDNLIGTVNIKLIDFESMCTIHNSFPLMDGRKSISGKIECKIRLRQPLVNKQIEQVQQKWLVIQS